jgi:hypothetical protein
LIIGGIVNRWHEDLLWGNGPTLRRDSRPGKNGVETLCVREVETRINEGADLDHYSTGCRAMRSLESSREN